MSFLDQIFGRLEASAGRTLLTELREPGPIPVTGRDLLAKIAQARAFLAARGLQKGDRVALLAAEVVQQRLRHVFLVKGARGGAQRQFLIRRIVSGAPGAANFFLCGPLSQ